MIGDSIEHEFKYAGKYGAKGEKREKRQKPTPEQIKKQNQANREKKMRRLIKANFRKNDLWCTLKYPEGKRKTLEEVKKDLSRFLCTLRRVYGKQNVPLKWVRRIEIGSRGGIHIHLLVNRLPRLQIDAIIQEKWNHGRVNYTNVYEAGGMKQLASYLVKQPDEAEEEQLSLFEEAERKELISYSTSRNLKRPEPTREKIYSHRTVRKLVEQGPTPTKGYVVDPDSILAGINRYTGMSYYQYIEYQITPFPAGEVNADADGRYLHRDKHKRTAPGNRKSDVPDANTKKGRKAIRKPPGSGRI